MIVTAVWLLAAWPLAAAGPSFAWRTMAPAQGIQGMAVEGGTIALWGGHIEWRDLPRGTLRKAMVPAHPLGEGGAMLDVNRDGHPDLVVNEADPPALAWYDAASGARHVIDTGVDAPDMVAAELFGRRGVLLIHKRQQVRFYVVPADPADRWPARDIYSVYTPSWQGGLALADIDGDGRPDILCGNYWIRSPDRFELPWRLYAINTWTEEEHSGMMSLAWGGFLAVAQRLLPHGRVAWFARPADPQVQWPVHNLGRFDRPSLVIAGRDLVVAENGGDGRVVLYRGPDFTGREIRRGPAVRLLRATAAGILLVTSRGVELGSSTLR